MKHSCPKITKRFWSDLNGLNLHRFTSFQLFVSIDRALLIFLIIARNNINLFISFRNKANNILDQIIKIIISSWYFYDKVNPFDSICWQYFYDNFNLILHLIISARRISLPTVLKSFTGGTTLATSGLKIYIIF